MKEKFHKNENTKVVFKFIYKSVVYIYIKQQENQKYNTHV